MNGYADDNARNGFRLRDLAIWTGLFAQRVGHVKGGHLSPPRTHAVAGVQIRDERACVHCASGVLTSALPRWENEDRGGTGHLRFAAV